MKTWQAHQLHGGWRLPICRLAAGALVAVLGLGTPQVRAQQSQEAPTTTQEAPPSGEATAPADLTERQFDDWLLRCGRTQQGPEVCEMQQQRTDSQGRVVMAVAVGTVPGTSDLGLLIILPLGISLPPGVTLAIDGGAETPLEVERCERQGCRIEMLMKPELLNRLKAGREAKVFFEAMNPQGQIQRLGIPISLLGFTAALEQLTRS